MLVVSREFAALAAVVALAGTFLARSTDQIAEIARLGRLLIGSVLLAAATSLPELTVDISAVRQGMPDLAAGDLFGSSLMNLLILAVQDLAHRSGGKMLSREAAAHALSATLSIALTALASMAILTAPRLPGVSFLGIGIWSWGILVGYLLGVRMIFLDQRVSARAVAEAVDVAESDRVRNQQVNPPLWKPVVVFSVAALVLFLAGPRLAHVAGQLADLSGLGKTFVGTTLVALCTSLPELVASITALRMKSFDLVIGNVFGSNAFNMIFFFLGCGTLRFAVCGHITVARGNVVGGYPRDSSCCPRATLSRRTTTAARRTRRATDVADPGRGLVSGLPALVLIL